MTSSDHTTMTWAEEMDSAPRNADAGGGQDISATEWTVDKRCINCNAAREFAPDLIGIGPGGQFGVASIVTRQPETDTELEQIYAAAFACPTRSVHPPADDWDFTRDPFPKALDPDGVVLSCGHTSLKNFGGSGYLIRRPDATMMMVDSPRWSKALARRYDAMGPVTDVLLTHCDHVAHGRQWADHFGARLWIHEGDLDSRPDADQVIRGTDPVEIGPGVTVYPARGHTPGSVLIHVDDTFCFTGDTVYWSHSEGDLEIAHTVVFDSLDRIADTLDLMAELRVEYVLPGHGDSSHLPAEETSRRLRALADRVRTTYEPRDIDYNAVKY